MRLWDFVSSGRTSGRTSGRNEVRAWMDTLSRLDQARVEQKLGMLMRVDFNLLIHTHCLAGPVDERTQCIYKLRVRGDKNIRLLLCKGPDPQAMNEEYTLLLGATEPNRILVPKHACDLALKYRSLVLKDLSKQTRCPHEWLAATAESAVS